MASSSKELNDYQKQRRSCRIEANTAKIKALRLLEKSGSLGLSSKIMTKISKKSRKRKRFSRDIEQGEKLPEENDLKMITKKEVPAKLNTVSRGFITSLEMNTKKMDLFKDSQFLELLKIKNNSPSSASLIHALCSFYNVETKLFQLNEKVSFTFCEAEVAAMLGIKYQGKKLKEIKSSSSGIPAFVRELEDLYMKSKTLDRQSIRKIVKSMKIDCPERELQYQMLVRYYLIERFLLPSADFKCRSSFFSYVQTFEVFESINWAAAALEAIFKAASKAKIRNQKNFSACSPLFEAMIYNKLPKLKALYTGERDKCATSLPVENVFNPKMGIEFWKNELMTQEEVLMCASCPMEKSLDNSERGPHEDEGLKTPSRDKNDGGLQSDLKDLDGKENQNGMGCGSNSQDQEDGKMQCDSNPQDDYENMHCKANIEEDTTEVLTFSLSTVEEEIGTTLLSKDSSGSDAIEEGTSGKAIIHSTCSIAQSHKSGSGTTKFEGFNIRSDLVPTLQKIWQKHGNIIKDSILHNSNIIATSLELAIMVRELEDNSAQSLDDDQAKYLSSTLSDLRSICFQVDPWLSYFVEKALNIHKKKVSGGILEQSQPLELPSK